MKDARPTMSLAWVFGLTVIGYPVAGVLAVFAGLPSAGTSYPFRALVVVLAGAMFLRVGHVSRATRLHPWLAAFWAMYAMRLLWDMAVGTEGAGAALFFFLTTVLVPVGCMSRAARAWDEVAAARVVFLLGTFISASAIVLEVFGYAGDRSLTEATGRLFLDTVNPITFGHAGVSTLLAAAVLYYGRRSAISTVSLSIGAGLAVACIILAASRGPVVALAACAVAVAISQGRWTLVLILTLGILGAMWTGELDVVSRFYGLEDDASSLERLLLQANAIQMFSEHPLLGSAYAEFELNTYPHNMFIETAMALGIVGLASIIALTLISFGRAWAQLLAGRILLPLLFFQYFLGFQFSGSLWGSHAFWACTALLLSRPTQATWRRIRTPRAGNATARAPVTTGPLAQAPGGTVE